MDSILVFPQCVCYKDKNDILSDRKTANVEPFHLGVQTSHRKFDTLNPLKYNV